MEDVIFVCRGHNYYQTVITFSDGLKHTVDKTLQEVVHDLCNYHGIPLEANRQISRKIFNYHKKAPIFFPHVTSFALLPTSSLEARDCCLLNPYRIKDIRPIDKSSCCVQFLRGQHVHVSTSMQQLKKQMDRTAFMSQYYRKPPMQIKSYMEGEGMMNKEV